jgi:hypothetical protein
MRIGSSRDMTYFNASYLILLGTLRKLTEQIIKYYIPNPWIRSSDIYLVEIVFFPI